MHSDMPLITSLDEDDGSGIVDSGIQKYMKGRERSSVIVLNLMRHCVFCTTSMYGTYIFERDSFRETVTAVAIYTAIDHTLFLNTLDQL